MMNLARNMMSQSLQTSAQGLHGLVSLMGDRGKSGVTALAPCRPFWLAMRYSMSALMSSADHQPDWVAYRGFESMDFCGELLGRFVPPGENRLAWWELRNKLRAFCLFQYVDAILEVPSQGPLNLLNSVQQAKQLGPYKSVWAWEGLGRSYGRRELRRGRSYGMLSEFDTGLLPHQALVPLHVGMGLCFAEQVFEHLDSAPSQAQLRQALRQHLDLCDANARPAYRDACCETLGVVIFNLYPHLIHGIGAALAHDPHSAGLFWHGIGRGAYFAVESMLPLAQSPTHALEFILQSQPASEIRSNLIAGVIWAQVLVNLNNPEILLASLGRFAAAFQAEDGLRDGIASALRIWQLCASDDPWLKAFVNFQPEPKDRQLWNTWVLPACHDGLAEEHHPFQSGEYFRYRSSTKTACSRSAIEQTPILPRPGLGA